MLCRPPVSRPLVEMFLEFAEEFGISVSFERLVLGERRGS